MATLLRVTDGHRCALPARALLGRAATATVRLSDRFASSEHARIAWVGDGWEIRDLGSTNGTFVDGAVLPAGGSRRIGAGARIGFGEAPGEGGWVLEDASEPAAIAVDLADGSSVSGTPTLLQLPSADAPELTVYRTQNGDWRLEDPHGAARPLEPDEIVEIAGRRFRLELPEPSDLTPMADVAFSVKNLTIRMHAPPSLERISLELVHTRQQKWLEPREHSFLLYLLARERAADRAKPEAERGWRTVAWLSKATKLDEAAVNVLIHRARMQLAAAGVEGAAEIVEVRRGQRRLGTDQFELVSTD